MSIIALESAADVEALLARPEPVWLFKHSSACGVSHAAQEVIDAFATAHPTETIGRVVIQSHRPLSTWIAERLGRTHQSPQLFRLHSGAVIWATSHWGITAADMERQLAGSPRTPDA